MGVWSKGCNDKIKSRVKENSSSVWMISHQSPSDYTNWSKILCKRFDQNKDVAQSLDIKNSKVVEKIQSQFE